MPLILEASSLSLNDVHRLLKLEELSIGSFTDFLNLESLTDIEQQDLVRISNDFQRYFKFGKISEGLVKFLTLAPLMRLAGFYDVPIRLTMEDSIAIAVEDEDKRITGRMDILAINNAQSNAASSFWILVIETKNSAIHVGEGLPQLISYAFKSLEQQLSVWGLVTNGQLYQFVYLTRQQQPTYQLMPLLNLNESPDAIELLQVLKKYLSVSEFSEIINVELVRAQQAEAEVSQLSEILRTQGINREIFDSIMKLTAALLNKFKYL